MESLGQDLRYALRGLRNQPGFAALAVLTLALGIGATTTMYSVIYNVLFDPMPYKESERVVVFQIRQLDRAAQPGGRTFFQGPEWMDFREQNHVYEEVVATASEDILMTTSDGTLQFDGGIVSENMFSFLAVPPLYGRVLTPEDARAGAPPVFVMAYKMWTKHYNFDPTVVGRTFILNGVPTTCVGVMPRRFTKMNSDLYRPVVMERANPAIQNQYFMFQGKVKPGVTLAQVEADISVVARNLAKVYPQNYPEKGFVVKAVSWLDNVIGPFRQTLTTLAAAVALLLLIACTNVANLLLARATAREKEMALRASLGATRGRLVRQLLIESLVLAFLGAAVGCGLAWAGVKALVAYIPDGAIPKETVIHLNWQVLVFSLIIAGVTAVIFGLVPALQAARKNLVEPLKDGGKGSGGGFRRAKLRNGLVVAEVALSLMLLAGAGLLMRSFVKLTTVDLGFDPSRLVIARLPLPRGQYDTAADKQRYFSQISARLQALPGVVAVTPTASLPGFGGVRGDIDIPGGKPHTERWPSFVTLCSEGYLPTMGLRLQRGRFLSETDVNSSRRVTVVSAEFAKRYFGTTDPLGQMVTFKVFDPRPNQNNNNSDAAANANPPPPNLPFEVIGVVADIKNRGPQDPTEPEAYVPYAVTGNFDRAILVRAAGHPLALVNSMRKEIWAQDKAVAMTDIDSVEGYLRRYVYATPQFSLLVLGVFASVGLVLVALGIYSVVAYTVSRQTHELGIRMALGATRSDVLGLVMRMGMGLVLLGAITGLLVSVLLTRVLTLTNRLWQVPPNDPLTLAAVFAVITLAGFVACFVPARRATKVDPMVALRHE